MVVALTVVTGANSGIGLSLSIRLAKMGVPLLAACRNQQRANEAAEAISQAAGVGVRTGVVDLMSFESVRKFAKSLEKERVRCLVNNAGCMQSDFKRTEEDGLETCWQTNCASQYLLSQLMLPTLRRESDARLIYVGSRLERRGTLSVESIDAAIRGNGGDGGGAPGVNEENYSTFGAYAQSKQAATSLFYGIKAKEDETTNGVLVCIVTPGMVNTGISRFLPLYLQYLSFPIRWLVLPTSETGADPVFYLATTDADALRSAEGTTTRTTHYWQKRISPDTEPQCSVEASAASLDLEIREKLVELMHKQCSL